VSESSGLESEQLFSD